MYGVLSVLVLTGFYKGVLCIFWCNFEIDNVKFDLEPLDNTYRVTSLYNLDEGLVNRTWSISLCRKLNFNDEISNEYACSNGTNICGVKTLLRDNKLIVKNVQGLHFDIYSKYLTNNGLQIFFHNAQFRENNLSAMINFICNEKEHDPKFISYSRSHLQLKWKTNTVYLPYYFKDYGSQIISFVKQTREPGYRGYTSI
ncbi:hypothetical protein PMAC_002297 [Pneumocystis sp. 'macacae']|nr:hypothetical protein PMAC_002297 [Pneumocystis sp. 'macacae']